MSVTRLLGVLGVAAGLLVGTTVAAQEPVARKDGCTGFRFNLDTELGLFAGAPSKLASRVDASAAPTAETGRLYEVQLLPQADVRFAVAPDKATVADGSYAGLLHVRTQHKGTLRVTLDEAAWVDVISDNALIASTAHTGSAACKLLHKSVEFPVTGGKLLTVQVSGSTVSAIKLTLTQQQ